MQAPTAADLLNELVVQQANELVVQQALEQAWTDSLPGDPVLRHEEGGWIYVNTTTWEVLVRRAPAGVQATLNLNSPLAVPDAVVVATFHTHPNPSAEGWDPGPSMADIGLAFRCAVPNSC